MADWIARQMERESDLSTPPWLTVRMWLSVSAMVLCVVALIAGA